MKHDAQMFESRRASSILSRPSEREQRERRLTIVNENPLCYICCEQFKPGEDLVFLPCELARIQDEDDNRQTINKILTRRDGIDLSHIFHSECLKETLVESRKCFICKTLVTKKTFETFQNYAEF